MTDNVTALSDRVGAGLEAPKPDVATLQGQALLAVVDFFGEYETLPAQPLVTIHGHKFTDGRGQLSWYLHGGPDALATAIELRRVIGGRWAKTASEDTIYLRQVRPHLDLTITVDREQACTRRVVGTREVVVPAQPAVPATTRVVEDVEWDCHPLLDPASDAL